MDTVMYDTLRSRREAGSLMHQAQSTESQRKPLDSHPGYGPLYLPVFWVAFRAFDCESLPRCNLTGNRPEINTKEIRSRNYEPITLPGSLQCILRGIATSGWETASQDAGALFCAISRPE